MKFSLRLNNDLPVSTYIRLAQLAEAVGFDQFWVSNDLFLRSAPVILSAVATVTSRIQIGSCIFNPYTLHPAEIAMFAATLDELSAGRFLLGIAAGAGEFLKWVGIEQKHPVGAMRETIFAINQLMQGETANIQGEFIHWSQEAYLRFKPARRVPIYVGAMSPKMLSLTGEIADGGLPLLLPPEHYETVLPYIQEGVTKAGRSLEDLDIAACIWCSISEDRQAAEDMLREKVAYYGHAMSPLIWERLGLTRADFDPIEQASMVENDLEKAKRLVTPSMLNIGIVGTVEDLIPRLDRLRDAGVKHLSFGPPLGPNLDEAIKIIGEKILPRYQTS